MFGTLGLPLRGLLAALLPSPERERFARDRGIDAPRWSLAVGFGQLVLGGMLFLLGGLSFIRGGTLAGIGVLLENWWPGLSSTHMQGMGLVNAVAWVLHPLSWPLVYVATNGAVRCVAYVATREAVAEPLVWMVLRVFQQRRVLEAERRFRDSLGPYRPDRIVRAGKSELVVLSSREKTGWSETVTIRHDGRYYKCVEAGLRDDGAWKVLFYRLREEPPGAIIRRLVRYDRPRP